jgi:hypothetical protein
MIIGSGAPPSSLESSDIEVLVGLVGEEFKLLKGWTGLDERGRNLSETRTDLSSLA